MILRYHVTARYSAQNGLRTHERGIGSLFHLSETELMRKRAIEIARDHQYITVSVCAPKGKDAVAEVYFRDIWGKNVLHKSYSKRLDEDL
jgi:hypothetical protein